MNANFRIQALLWFGLACFWSYVSVAADGRGTRTLPAWEEGDWWIVSCEDLMQYPEDGPTYRLTPDQIQERPLMRAVTMEFRFLVAGSQKVSGDDCDVLEIRTFRVPSWVKDDTDFF